MIENFKDVTSENPIGQIWKYLRSFLDVTSVSEKIRHIHTISDGRFDSDVKKQARQIGYCVRQAEEYFQASSQVSLATRPILIYYGATSLSRALTLLRQDGSHSFDALRKSNKHNHHGLDLVRGLAATARPFDGPEVFFNSLQCKLHTKSRSAQSLGIRGSSSEKSPVKTTKTINSREKIIPWGNFPLFYRSLVPCAFLTDFQVLDRGKSTFIKSARPDACADLLPLDSLIPKRFETLTILKTLPDMYFALEEFGIEPNLCRGSSKLSILRSYKRDDQGEKQLRKIKEEYHFFIDGVSTNKKRHFLAHYRQKNPSINVEADLGMNIHLKLVYEYSPTNKLSARYLPDIVDDINGRKFYIIRPEAYLPEPASHLVLLYCLGMLSRYYPHIWIKAIDENVQIAELTDSLLNIVYRKFPNLILDQMTWTKHYVHL